MNDQPPGIMIPHIVDRNKRIEERQMREVIAALRRPDPSFLPFVVFLLISLFGMSWTLNDILKELKLQTKQQQEKQLYDECSF